MRYTRFALTAAVVLALSACDGDTSAPTDSLDAADAATVAADIDAAAAVVLHEQVFFMGFPGARIGRHDDRTFSRTRSCPGGGQVEVTGSATRTALDDGVFEFEMSADGTITDCVHGRGDRTITTNGTFELTAYRKWSRDEGPIGVQTATKTGRIEWSRSDGESGVCEISLVSERDPATMTVTIEGSVCGRDVSREHEWRVGR